MHIPVCQSYEKTMEPLLKQHGFYAAQNLRYKALAVPKIRAPAGDPSRGLEELTMKSKASISSTIAHWKEKNHRIKLSPPLERETRVNSPPPC